jgi:hypothetical protein
MYLFGYKILNFDVFLEFGNIRSTVLITLPKNVHLSVLLDENNMNTANLSN